MDEYALVKQQLRANKVIIQNIYTISSTSTEKTFISINLLNVSYNL